MLLVDELQDTGWFLGEVIRGLLGEPETRGVLVGDPDQAIYEFAGALPKDVERFRELEGAHTYPLRTSFRCPRRVCRVASQLSQSGQPVKPADNAKEGKTVLVVYEREPALDVLCAEVENEIARGHATILGRRGKDLKGMGPSLPRTPGFHSSAIGHMWDATAALHRRDTVKALAAATAALNQCVFGTTFARQDDLETVSLDSWDWRSLCVGALLGGYGAAN